MSVTNTNQSPGVRPAGPLSMEIVLGAPTLERGLVRVIPNEAQNVDIERFSTTDQHTTGLSVDPSAGASADASTKDFVTIETGGCQFYDTTNPRVDFLDKDWARNWGSGKLTDHQVAPHIRSAITEGSLGSVHRDLERLIWLGDTASGNAWLNRFDGLIKTIEADGTVNNVTPAGAITKANIFDIIDAVINTATDEILEAQSPTIVMSHADKHIYYSALRDAGISKGVNVMDGGVDSFGGYRIVSCGIPKDHIVMTRVGTGNDSNLVAATWTVAGYNSPKIAPVKEFSEEWGFLFKYRFGINIVWGKDVVYYKPV